MREFATRAVWVIYDRGPESRELYDDQAVFEFAEKQRLGLLWARHCPGANSDDIDTAPEHGLGRALLAALDAFAQVSRHGELTTSRMIVLGSNEAGVLAARMPESAPERVLGSVTVASDALDSANLESVAVAVPQLVISGTRGGFESFGRHFAEGAPWAFLPHRGSALEIKPLMFAWIEALLDATPPITAPRDGWQLFVKFSDAAVAVEDAKIGNAGTKTPGGYVPAGWVPSKKVASEWRSLVRKSVR
jgi:hypothetical protein